MKNDVKVSVVMPVYNTELYLKECLDSVINQTLREIEIICVDDGSTDNSLEILKSYAKKDSRFTILTQKNLYAGVARNNGMAHATGKYIIFLDSDDYFHLDMLEKAYEKAEEVEAEIVIFDIDRYDDKTKEIIFYDGYIRPEYMKGASVCSGVELIPNTYRIATTSPWNKFYLKSFIDDNKLIFQNIKSTNDLSFILTSFSIAKRITMIDEILLIYRVNTGTSLQSSSDKNIILFLDAIKELENELTRLNIYGVFQNIIYDFYSTSIYNLIYVAKKQNNITNFNKTYDYFHSSEIDKDKMFSVKFTEATNPYHYKIVYDLMFMEKGNFMRKYEYDF